MDSNFTINDSSRGGISEDAGGKCSQPQTLTSMQESITEFRHGKQYAALTSDDMIGEEFDSLEDAEKFYKTYGNIVGFGVRKHSLQKDGGGELRRRVWVCDKEGYRSAEWLEKKDRKREHRALTRVGCRATFSVTKDLSSSKWKVTKLVTEHSHDLLKRQEIRFIRSHRSVPETLVAQAKSMHTVGIGPSRIMEYMVDQAGGYDRVGFTRKDLENKLMAERSNGIVDTDSETLLAYFKTKSVMDPDLFCRYTTDSHSRLENIFWVDTIGRYDYCCFGDVLAFDATYKTNAYGKPLVILIGVNNHNRTTIFGLALLVDETVETYTWVLRTFLDAMNNKHPSTVITDGDKAMRKAIKAVLPDSYHRLCAWHLERNAQANLHDPQVQRTFTDCMLGDYSNEEFETRWMRMIARFELHGNDWLKSMHETKEMWAESYMKGNFFAGMRSTQRCESANRFINQYVKVHLKLYEFVICIDKVISRMRNQEVYDDVKCKNCTPVPITHLKEIEEHAARVYTRKIFKKLQEQIQAEAGLIKIGFMAYSDRRVYMLTRFMKPQSNWVVTFIVNERHIECSCNIFASIGIPCSHAFYVMKEEQLGEIPEPLIMQRWTKDAKVKNVNSNGIHELSDEASSSLRYGALSVDCNKLCLFGSKTEEGYKEAKREIARLTSRMEGLFKVYEDTKIHIGDNKHKNNIIRDPLVVKTKGATAGGPNKESKERRCSRCKKVGHTKRTCRIQLNIDVRDVSNTMPNEDIADGEPLFGTNYSQTNNFTNQPFVDNAHLDDIEIDLTQRSEFDSQPTRGTSFNLYPYR